VPFDPYTDGRLHCRVLPDGAVAYSVASNHSDDDGDELPQHQVPKDRGVRLYNPDRRGLKFEDVYGRPDE